MASAADVVSNPLPPGVIPASEFNPSSIPPSTHLFFDDDINYIVSVQERMNQRELPVACVYCRPPVSVVLHAHNTGLAVTEIKYQNKFREMKQLGTPRGRLRDFLGQHIETTIGTGFTTAMISQLIEHERGAATMTAGRKRQRLYFFDFDKTLTYVPGMSFAFLQENSKTRPVPTTEISPSERILLSQYAKYLFSDYCGEEPAEGSGNGRMNLLRELFRVIGNQRIYIVTANKSATNVPANPYYMYFKYLICELLPDFLEDHIIGVHSFNAPPLLNKKEDAIAKILQDSPRSPRSPRGTVTKKSPRSPRSPRSPKKSPQSPSNGHGRGGRKRMSQKPYHRIYRYSRSSLRRSTRKRHT